MKETIFDCGKVIGVNSVTVGVVTWSNIELAGKLLLIALSIGYTLWKWNNDIKQKDKSNE